MAVGPEATRVWDLLGLAGWAAMPGTPWAMVQLLPMLLPVLVSSALLFVGFEKPFMQAHWPKQLGGWVRGTDQAQPEAGTADWGPGGAG